jgi:ATP-binding cassette, subfamily C (CFTR/MRP), member 1
VIILLAAANLIQVALKSPLPAKDAAVYTAALQCASFILALLLTRLNHTTTRRSSTILLTFWPIFLIAKAVQLRTHILTDSAHLTDLQFATECIIIALGCCAFTMELKGPQNAADLEKGESPYGIANVYSRYVRSALLYLLFLYLL